MKSLKLAAILLVTGILSGCMSDTQGSSAIADPDRVNEIVVGTTTRDQVLASLGEPLSRSSSGGVEYWTYQYSETSLNAAMFVPVVQMAAGRGNYETVTMIVTFGGNGVVQNVTRRCSRGSSGMLTADRSESFDC